MLINIKQITELTGVSRITAAKRCIDLEKIKGVGKEVLYESKDALQAVYGQYKNKEARTLEGERTRLASAQAEKTELEVEVIKGNLIPADTVEETVNSMVSAFRARMLSLPTKAAPLVLPLADLTEAESIIRDLVYEALTELSNYDPENYRKKDDKKGSKAGSAAAKADSERVGGRKKKTVKGGQRGTRPVEH